MATGRLNGLIQRLRRVTRPHDEDSLADAQLLECFIAQRDEAAFETLVRRHGPMVHGVCSRVLRDTHDVEDAFQATFLVLVRKAGAIGQRDLLGNWLYGVAYRAALEVKAARRRVREREVSAMSEPAAVSEAEAWRELRPVLDQELNRLPDKFRLPVVLCDLEGRTLREVARQLGIPEGTLSGRLTTARRKLAQRLARHDLAIAVATLATALSQNGASAAVPASLIGPTIKAAALLAAGETTGVVSAHVAAAMDGVLKGMLLTKLKMMVAFVVVLGLFAAGMGTLAHYTLADSPADRPIVAADNPQSPSAADREPVVEEQVQPPQRNDGGTVAGKLEAVDLGKNSVTISTFSRTVGRNEKSYEVAKDAKVLQHGKEANLSDLKRGSQATLSLSADQKTVASIVVGNPPISAALKSADAANNTITITVENRQGKQDKSYPVAKDAKITIDGKEAQLADLKVGTVLTLFVDDTNTIIEVRTPVRRTRKQDE